MMENETANIQRDAVGNIIIDENGYVTCISEGGLQFQLCYDEINFSCDSITCTVDNKSIFIPLNDNNNIIENEQGNNEKNIIQENVENEEETFSWSDASTKLFLHLYKEKINLVSTRKIKNKKILWQKIAEEMSTQGYNVSNIQAENKFKSLERSYKNMITNNKKTGRGRASCRYETELTDLLGKKHNIEPLVTSGNKGTIVRTEKVTPIFSPEIETIENTQNLTKVNATSQKLSIVERPRQNEEPSTSTIHDQQDATSIQKQQQEINEKSEGRSSKRQMGTTARILQTCQETIKDLTNRIQEERHNKIELERQVLVEYKQMRQSYETHLQKIEEQLTIANKLREERNNLLKTLVSKQNNI
ncbi:PREDICTED: uncharacterized protein LOC105570890 [Vollenhovia emeryi]|uniref:uncharacterized protein LOC105570890 n=1 Tax=Vollenhovia emeryi TaxID=411798 RepID=UPI0005F4ED08|nr:PREDICTED: uncharacterized protein LOC105570890 [Vollenhovia emeryi]